MKVKYKGKRELNMLIGFKLKKIKKGDVIEQSDSFCLHLVHNHPKDWEIINEEKNKGEK